MRRVLLHLLRWIFLGLISLRYKVRKENDDLLDSEILKGKPLLVLPNHTSLLDGLLITVTLNLRFDLRPLVYDKYYKSLFFKPFKKLLNAIHVPDLLTGVNQEKIEKTKQLIDIVCNELDNNRHILLFPSGGMKHSSEELIGGRSLTYEILKRNPNIDVLLVRISGLWGSHLSRESNKTPSAAKEMLRALSIISMNGIFFAPKRRLLLEFKHSKGDIPLGTKQSCNSFLEAYFNQYPTDISFKDIEERSYYERIIRTRIHFLAKEKVVDHVEQSFALKKPPIEDHILPQHVKSDIYYKISELTQKPVGEINQTDHLVFNLGLDSLDVAALFYSSR